ncbi:TIGR02588 family protein [Microvirga splendida]|uniref:TIGR02588 family protein n=1 Tax=Microvirga splendida TaxID=2795727 RepID=A0ABS0Y488_9HYPH|nr:TIGR02588 family protein [Microvirga splendida]MBJ6127097.1 TIGR02588 family protein [Microvirga splendida]
MNAPTKSPPRKSESSRQIHPGSTTSKWEWVAAACGLLLVLGTLGYIVYYALTTEAKIPDITAEAIRTEPTRGGHVVQFRARNHSSTTAAGLQITGELRQGSSVVERSEITLDYLPPFSEREGGLIFQEDPARYELRIAPKAYREP